MIVVPIPPDALPIPPLPNTQALSSSTFNKPPLDGSLTIPEIYDWHYDNNPDHPLFIYSDSRGDVRTIFWPEVVLGVHRVAKIVQSRTLLAADGKPCIVGILAASGSFLKLSFELIQCLTATSPLDTISFFTLIVGVIRAGCVPFLISPRNSAAAVARLVADTGTCHILLGHDQPIQDLASEALSIFKNDPKHRSPPALPEVSLVPLFDDMYRPTEEPFERLPPTKFDPRSLAVIVHSSGSLVCMFLVLACCLSSLHFSFRIYGISKADSLDSFGPSPVCSRSLWVLPPRLVADTS